MIKWIRGILYDNPQKQVGHIFEYKDKSISFTTFDADIYPPFDCVRLDKDSAIKLRDFLNEVLDDND